MTTNYLVYSPLAYNRPDDNWLLDVELYSEEFRADLISIWMDEMGPCIESGHAEAGQELSCLFQCERPPIES